MGHQMIAVNALSPSKQAPRDAAEMEWSGADVRVVMLFDETHAVEALLKLLLPVKLLMLFRDVKYGAHVYSHRIWRQLPVVHCLQASSAAADNRKQTTGKVCKELHYFMVAVAALNTCTYSVPWHCLLVG